MAQYVAKQKQYRNRLAKLNNDPMQEVVAGQKLFKIKAPKYDKLKGGRWRGERGNENLLNLFYIFFTLFFFHSFFFTFVHSREGPQKISEQTETGYGLYKENSENKHVKHKRAETSMAKIPIF